MPEQEPSYAEAVRWMTGLAPAGIRLGLDRMRAALAAAGDPHLVVPAVHVAGTNGKGSTALLVAEALRRSGHRVGLYTSPHLHRFAERIRIDGEPVSDGWLASETVELRRMLEADGAPKLSFFEAATWLAFRSFAQSGCEIAVLEVGLGGRLDATNVIEAPLATAVVSIGMDHQGYLGSSLASIAAEKAGVIKAGAPVVTGALPREAAAVVATVAAAHGATLHRLGHELTLCEEPGGLRIGLGDDAIAGLRPGLAGAHQRDNAAVAAGLLLLLRRRGIGVEDEQIRAAFAEARWPGRLERLERPGGSEDIDGEQSFLLDGAHNLEGATALADHLRSLPPRRRVLLFGAMEDKPHAAILELLGPLFSAVVCAEIELPRAAPAAALAAHRGDHVEADPGRALRLARELAGPEGEIVVAGSLYLVAAARADLLGLGRELALGM